MWVCWRLLSPQFFCIKHYYYIYSTVLCTCSVLWTILHLSCLLRVPLGHKIQFSGVRVDPTKFPIPLNALDRCAQLLIENLKRFKHENTNGQTDKWTDKRALPNVLSPSFAVDKKHMFKMLSSRTYGLYGFAMCFVYITQLRR